MADLKQYVDLDSSSSNIPTAFAASAGSLILSGLGGGKATLIIISTCEEFIEVNYSAASSTVAPTTIEACVPAAATGSHATLTLADVDLGDAVYIQSRGSAISTGSVIAFTV